MDYKNIITFILKDQKYHLYSNVAVKLPIFEELQKSDKIETIEYEPDIDDKEINFVFAVLNNNYKETELTIKNTVNIYNFMMFLTMDVETINKSVGDVVNKYDFMELAQYCIDHSCRSDFVDFVGSAHKEFDDNSFQQLKQLPRTNPVVVRLLKCYINNDKDEDFDIVYAIKVIQVVNPMPTADSEKYNYAFTKIKKFYKKILDADITCSADFEKHQIKEFIVNDKPVEIVGNIDVVANYYIGCNLADTIKNHVMEVLLGKIDL